MRKRLRGTAVPLTPAELADPDIQFFAHSNPGHVEGDMLICLCPMSLSNWMSVGKKALQRHRRRTVH